MQKFGWAEEHAWGHVEWVLQRQFKTPTKWFGEEGTRFRQTCGMPQFPPKTVNAWDLFSAGHDGKSLSDIEALMNQEDAA